MDRLLWIWSRREAIAAVFMAGLIAWTPIATFLARLIARPAPAAAWWKRALYDIFVDTPAWAAALGHSGILGGIFNFPGIPSRAPEQNPTPHESKMMRTPHRSSFGPGEDTRHRRGRVALLWAPLALGLGLAGMAYAAAGCGTTGAAIGQAIGRCEVGALPSELEGVLASVLAAALTPAGVDWQAQLDHAVANVAPAQGQCVIQAAAAWFEQLTSKKGEALPAYVEAQKRLHMYAEQHAPRSRLEHAGPLLAASDWLAPSSEADGVGGVAIRFDHVQVAHSRLLAWHASGREIAYITADREFYLNGFRVY